MSIEPFTDSYTADQVNDIIERLAVLAWSLGMDGKTSFPTHAHLVDPRELGSRIASEIRKQKITFPDNPNPGESK